jgi:AcrR family transcriptional regulator
MLTSMKQRDEQILKAAEDLFYERSFGGVGVAEIGKRAGVTGSAIYRHFESKDEILGVLFDRAADLILLNVGQEHLDPFEDLRSLATAHVNFAFEHYKLAAIWALDVRALSGQYLRSFRRRQHLYTERWITSLERCYPGHDRESLVAAVRGIWALLMSDSVSPFPGRAADSTKCLLVEVALAGLGALAQAEIVEN